MDITQMIRNGHLTVEQLSSDNMYVFKLGTADGTWMPTQNDLESMRDLIESMREGKESIEVVITHAMMDIKETPTKYIFIEKRNRLRDVE